MGIEARPVDVESPALEAAIIDRTAVVGVVGLGYVGLPLVVASSTAGFAVVGLDSDRTRVDSLNRRASYVADVSDTDLELLQNVRFTADPTELGRADVVIIAVPTPLADGVPDLTMVKGASGDISRSLRPGMLVILESTTYPGTTEEVVRPILESSGLDAERDFFLAYSPERIDPGSAPSFADTPKIVSGIGPAALELTALFYGQMVSEIVRVPSTRNAEMAKLIENTFRQVNIALVNELAILAPDLGVDIWAALEAAATKPFGYMPFWPGPGVGGHCIAIDPTYLSWRVDQRLGYGIGFVEHAKAVNSRMPGYVAMRIGDALNAVGKPVRGSSILILGATYKAGVNDVRESSSIAVMRRLAKAGARCSYHDPYVPSLVLLGEELQSQPLDPDVLAGHDCVAILTAHPGVDHAAVVRAAPLVFDARGVTRSLDAPNVVRL